MRLLPTGRTARLVEESGVLVATGDTAIDDDDIFGLIDTGRRSTALALDTSVAIPLLVATHRAHAAASRWFSGREVALSGHSVAETYSVLTRLPGDLRLAPADAARLLADRFVEPFLLGPDAARRLPQVLSRLGIAGGAVHDALVALAALEHGADLATRDARAKATFAE